jgi:hypothetical protein
MGQDSLDQGSLDQGRTSRSQPAIGKPTQLFGALGLTAAFGRWGLES